MPSLLNLPTGGTGRKDTSQPFLSLPQARPQVDGDQFTPEQPVGGQPTATGLPTTTAPTASSFKPPTIRQGEQGSGVNYADFLGAGYRIDPSFSDRFANVQSQDEFYNLYDEMNRTTASPSTTPGASGMLPFSPTSGGYGELPTNMFESRPRPMDPRLLLAGSDGTGAAPAGGPTDLQPFSFSKGMAGGAPIGLENLGAVIERMLGNPSAFNLPEVLRAREQFKADQGFEKERALQDVEADAASRGTMFSTVPLTRTGGTFDIAERFKRSQDAFDTDMLTRMAERQASDQGRAIDSAFRFGTEARAGQAQQLNQFLALLAASDVGLDSAGIGSLASLLRDSSGGGLPPEFYAMLGNLA